jgi:hypothetical protein
MRLEPPHWGHGMPVAAMMSAPAIGAQVPKGRSEVSKEA